jgi:hypothetical protein
VPGAADYRLLHSVAARAVTNGYLARTTDPRHRLYYEALKMAGRLESDRPLTICTASLAETADNPSGRYYLHDGSGRGLTCLILLEEGSVTYQAMRCYLAERAD